MHRAVIDDTQVVLVDSTVAVLIELGECHIYHFHSLRIWTSTNTNKEFIVAYDSVLVSVEIVKQESSLIFCNLRTQVLKSPVELLFVNFAITIVIHDSERSSHTTDGLDSSIVEILTDLLENYRNEK